MGTERDPVRLMAKAADRTGLQTRPRLAVHPAPIQARQGCDWEEAEIAKNFPGFFLFPQKSESLGDGDRIMRTGKGEKIGGSRQKCLPEAKRQEDLPRA